MPSLPASPSPRVFAGAPARGGSAGVPPCAVARARAKSARRRARAPSLSAHMRAWCISSTLGSGKSLRAGSALSSASASSIAAQTRRRGALNPAAAAPSVPAARYKRTKDFRRGSEVLLDAFPPRLEAVFAHRLAVEEARLGRALGQALQDRLEVVGPGGHRERLLRAQLRHGRLLALRLAEEVLGDQGAELERAREECGWLISHGNPTPRRARARRPRARCSGGPSRAC